MSNINQDKYYSQKFGHEVEDIKKVHHHITQNQGKKRIIWLAGDTTLDNKHWLEDIRKSCNGYEHIFEQAYSKADLCHWINHHMQVMDYKGWACINAAVNESSLTQRRKKGLLPQDEFIRDNLTEKDLLIISIGGNDLYSTLNFKRMTSMINFFLTKNPDKFAESEKFQCFVDLFKNQTEDYIKSLIAKHKPRKIIVCSLYHPSIEGKGWADKLLSLIRYKKNPSKVHKVVEAIFEQATEKIKIPGVAIFPVKLWELLDWRQPDNFIERVYPSAKGGKELSQGFLSVFNFAVQNQTRQCP